jgi:hypothetical protein
MDDPTAVVLAFIADHHRWNAAADDRDRLAGRSAARQQSAADATRAEWAALLARYCRPGFVGGPVAYGIPPLHDPACEAVVSARPRADRCLVRTRKEYEVGGVGMVQEFEYRLSRAAGRWFLESVRCVVDGRGYESL